MVKNSTNNKSRLNILFVLCILLSMAARAQTNDKQFFNEAKNEIEAMLNNRQPLDYERAVFASENAYHGNAFSFSDYKKSLDFIQLKIENLISQIEKTNTVIPKKNFLITTDSAEKNKHMVITNYAIFTYFTDTTIVKLDSQLYVNYPYTYSYNDPLASHHWENSQVLNLLSIGHAGNCNALTSLFKIFSLRFRTNVNLTTTQGHIFIRHTDENGKRYNVELASKSFPGTGSIEVLTHTSDEAARKGIAMRELNLKQSVGLCLINLAKAYQHKYTVKADSFMLQCAELALKHDSLNLNAMLLKAEIMEQMLFESGKPLSQLKATKTFNAYQAYITCLYDLGYREMPPDMKNTILAALRKDSSYISVYKDHTYYPFAHIDKNYKRTFSMSNGLFEEIDLSKPQEKYFRTVFDTKARKIIAFEKADTLYNNYDFDPTVFAWQIDPHYYDYPSISPYAAFADNPILNIDPDGRDVIPIIFPEYKIETGLGKVPGLGHAGVLIIDNQTGATAYYEYGRYDQAEKGIVRKVTVSDVIIKNGEVTTESLHKVLKQISTKSGHGGVIMGAYIPDDHADDMIKYANNRMANNNNPDREEYSLKNNNCGTFMCKTVDAGVDDNVEPKNWDSPVDLLLKYLNSNYDKVIYRPDYDATQNGKKMYIEQKSSPKNNSSKGGNNKSGNGGGGKSPKSKLRTKY